MNRQIIRDAGRRVGPEVRRNLFRRTQAHIDVGGDRGRVEPELRRPRPIDRRVERRCVDLLLEVCVGDARNCRDAPPKLQGNPQVCGTVVADRANVDLRGQAEIEDLRDDVGRLEVEQHVRKSGGQRRSQLAHIVGSRRMAVFQRDLDHAVIHADCRSVRERQIVGARWQSDVVDDKLEVAVRNNLADLVLDGLEDLFGDLDPRSGRSADVKLDLTAVDGRKEIAADERQQNPAEREHQDGNDRDDEPAREKRGQQSGIADAHRLETALEPGIEPAKPAARSAVVLALEQQSDGDRRQRP